MDDNELLMEAAIQGNLDTLKQLVKVGADYNKYHEEKKQVSYWFFPNG